MEEYAPELSGTIKRCGTLQKNAMNETNFLSNFHLYEIAEIHKKLEEISNKIDDWKGILPHDEYFVQFQNMHAKKSAFWKKYNNARNAQK